MVTPATKSGAEARATHPAISNAVARLTFVRLRETAVASASVKMTIGRWLTIAVLPGLLALVGWIGYRLWNLVDIDMPPWAWAALAFGVGLSLLVGFGLMALLFYSSRMGYDEPPHMLDNQGADK